MGKLALSSLCVSSLLVLLVSTSAEVFFEENFDAGWEDRWATSEFKGGDEGKWETSAGSFYGDENNKGGPLFTKYQIQNPTKEILAGLRTTTDYRWYDISAKTTPFSNKGKTLVLQYTVKHEQDLDCGGGYIKIAPSSVNQKKWGGDSDYQIMFGPDICGYSTKKVHVIFTYKGKNHLIKPEIRPETDTKTHIYTLIVKPDNTYEVQIDLKKVQSGSLLDDWDMLPPRRIKDPKAFKPEDWDEREEIDDPEDKKPDGYDDIPKQIVDPDAKKPDDWDEESDGEWEAPMIDNPAHKGEWKPKKIKNSAYKGKWVAPDIDNPDFVDDPNLYNVVNDGGIIGFELWQVKAGTIFDNILVCDDAAYAKEIAEKNIVPLQKKESEMKIKVDEDKRKKEEEERKEKETKEAAKDEDEDDDDDDEDDKKKTEL